MFFTVQILFVLLFLAAGYLLGSISPSIVFTRLFAKTDVRQHGSGNAGFTNTLRAAGKGAAALVFVCDALKALAAVLLAQFLAPHFTAPEWALFCRYAAAAGAVLGHNFPLYYGFRGGKGIVVSITIIFAFNWIAGLIVLGSFLVVFLLTGYVSLSSLTGAAALVVSSAAMACIGGLRANGIAADWMQFLFFLFLSVLAVWMHRANIRRLLNGTEGSFKKKR